MSTGLSPNDIRNYEFSNQMRGYDKDEVREFLEQIAVSLENLKQDNLKLSMERDSLRTQLEALKQFEDTIKSAAIDARRNADTLVANAKREVAEILDKARKEAEKAVGSRKDEAALLEQQINQLQMTKASYQTKLKHLIESHLELIEEVQRLKAPTIPGVGKTPKESPSDEFQMPDPPSKTAPAATSKTTDSTPWSQTAQAKSQDPFGLEPTKSPADFGPEPTDSNDPFQTPQDGNQDFFGESFPQPSSPRSHSASGGLEVEHVSEVTRKKLETFSTVPEPPESRRMEEANAPDRIIAVGTPPTGIQTKPDSPIDPELAAALDSYQRTHSTAPELTKTKPIPTVAAAPPAPADQSMRVIPTDMSETPATGKVPVQPPSDEPDNTEHNLIDIDQPIGDSQPGNETRTKQPGHLPDPEADSIARELDEVAARFEEEMDRAAKS